MKLRSWKRARSDRWVARVGVLAALGISVNIMCGAEAAGLTPRSVPVQARLAEEMAANQDWDETVRRWIEILYYFGPSDLDARAEFEIGAASLKRGRSDVAISQWEKTARRHPDTEWAERANEALALLGREPPSPLDGEVAPYITEDTPPDERQFLIAEGDLAAGLTEFAVRDYLKIPNSYHESPRAPEARFRVGTCQAILGHPERAVQQWDRLIEDYPDSPEARNARAGTAAWRAVLKMAGMAEPPPQGAVPEAEWRAFRGYATATDQGLSYAEDLFENGLMDYALQEYAKVLCDLYTPPGADNPHQAYARYRMGVCAYRLGERDAAARQWYRVIADFPDSPWAQHANRALAAVGATDPFSSDAGRSSPALPSDLPSPLVKRHHLAGQLVDCGLPLVASKEYLKVILVLTAGRPNPLQSEASYRLGVCQHLRGRPDLARRAWENTVAEHPDTTWAEKASAALSQAEQREKTLAASMAAPGP